MAVYKTYYYNRRTLSWIVLISCLYLLCSTSTIYTVTCSLENGERLRHHHLKNQLLEKSRTTFEDSSSISISKKEPLFGGCPNCLKDDEEKKKNNDRIAGDAFRLEAIKKQILYKLGFDVKPNITNHSLPKDVVLETLRRAKDDLFNKEYEQFEFPTTSAKFMDENVDVDEFYGRTSEILSFAEKGSWVNQNRLLEFKISSKESNQMGQVFRVREAILWIKADFLNGSSNSFTKCRSTDIFVFKIISNTLPDSITLTSKQFGRITSEPILLRLNENNSGWQKINITDIVSEWLINEPSNHPLKLFVDCSCCTNWNINLLNIDDETDDHNDDGDDDDSDATKKEISNQTNRPFMIIYTNPNKSKRIRRRRAIDCSEDSGDECCKQRFYVSFKALGWEDWILAPSGYYANYCRGDCGTYRTPDTLSTFREFLIEEVRKIQHLSGTAPCCAPLKFSSMSLVYYGHDTNVIKRDLPKMIVDECGCP